MDSVALVRTPNAIARIPHATRRAVLALLGTVLTLVPPRMLVTRRHVAVFAACYLIVVAAFVALFVVHVGR